MSSEDDRIVKMQFDNAQFKAKAAETKQSLADVNKAVDASGKSKGLLTLADGMSKVSVTASKMQVITTSALATIASKATSAGLNLVKSLTLDPIKQGFNEYGELLTKQNVIMNATGKSATQVRGQLNTLNTYSDKTIYSFSDMTEALTSFVNAGIKLPNATKAIQGIANASALAGATTQESKSSFQAFSQALGNGYLGLQDFRQAAITGKIGTVQFKQALIDAAVAQGTLTKRGNEYVTKNGKTLTATKGFNLSLQTQWANTQVLNKALRTYADTSTEAGRKAFAAATKVRTFSAFMSTLKESIGSTAARFFGITFGGLNQATSLWTGLSIAIGNGLGVFEQFGAAALHTWRRLGGMKEILAGFKNILAPIGALFTTVGSAFRAAFPGNGERNTGAGKVLYGMSVAFRLLTEPLALLAKLIRASEPALVIFFKAISTGIDGLKSLAGPVVDFVKSLTSIGQIKAPKAGGFLGFVVAIAHGIGDAVNQVANLIKAGSSLKDAFANVKFKMPSIPKLPSLGGLKDTLSSATGKGSDGAADLGSKIKAIAGALRGLNKGTDGLSKASTAADKVTGRLQAIGGAASAGAGRVKSFAQIIGDGFGKAKDFVGKFLKQIDPSDLVASFNLAVFTTFGIQIVKIFHNINQVLDSVGKIGKGAGQALEGLGNGLSSFQTAARAKLLIAIAIAIGILALSLLALSFVPADKLATGLAGLAGAIVLTSLLLKQMAKAADSIGDKKGIAKLYAIGGAMILFAGAILILSAAMFIMSKVPVQGIAKGLLTMAVAINLMIGLGKIAEQGYKNILAAGVAMTFIAGAMIGLALAFLLFKLVDYKSMEKAGIALAAMTGVLLGLSAIKDAKLASIGLAMLGVAGAMLILSVALIAFAAVKWSSIGKLAVVLAAVALALGAFELEGGPLIAATIVAIAGALVAIAVAGLLFNKVDWSSIAKVTVVLLALVVIFGLFLAVVTFFAPALILLSAFAGSLALLAGALALLALAFAVVFPLLAAGTGAFVAFATGVAVAIGVFMQTLAQEAPLIGQAFLAILQVLIDTIVAAVPMVIQGIKDLFSAVKKAFTDPSSGDAAGKGGESMLQKLEDKIKEWLPKIVQKGKDLLIAFLKGLAANAGSISAAAVSLLTKLVNGIASKAGGLITAGANLIIKLIQGIAKNAPRVAQAGVQAIIDLINAMAENIRTNGPQLGAAMGNLGVSMVEGLIGGVGAMLEQAKEAVSRVAHAMIDKAKSILKINSPSKVFMALGAGIVEGLTTGIQANAVNAITAVASMVGSQIAVASQYINAMVQDFDQKAIAARSQADGLAVAAEKAQNAAAKTKKNKKDDKAAKAIQNQADAASAAADAAEATAQAQRDAADRADEFNKATTIDKAKMRSEDAQNALDAAKAAEGRAAADLVAAQALEKQKRAKGVSAKEAKQLQTQADALRAQAKSEADAADASLDSARNYATDALRLQKQAGDEAAAAFQAAYDADAKAAADAKAYDAMSSADKAKLRRDQAAELQKQADADLAAAKQLAYSDLDAANQLAATAEAEADQARKYLDDATSLESGGASGGSANGTVVNIDPTEAAALAFNAYSDLYDSGIAAAAANQHLEFNQYNTSPEALSPIETYRLGKNLFTSAADQLEKVAS